ncbi:MAG: hypothetical protein ACPMAQ_00605 [Phycisphaerae bacterium]
MDVPRIGCILRDMGVLQDKDIEDILAQQSRTGQKFGLIAMRWGLATPEQVWEAWARQLALEVREANLDEVGTDSTALLRVTPELVIKYRIWPLRLWGDHLVVATGPNCPPSALAALAADVGLTVHRCIVPEEQIEGFIRHLCELEYGPRECVAELS